MPSPTPSPTRPRSPHDQGHRNRSRRPAQRGRDDELTRLAGVLGRPRVREARAVLIAGDAGVRAAGLDIPDDVGMKPTQRRPRRLGYTVTARDTVFHVSDHASYRDPARGRRLRAPGDPPRRRERPVVTTALYEIETSEADCRHVGCWSRGGHGFLGSRMGRDSAAGQVAGRGRAARRVNALVSSYRQRQVAEIRRQSRRPPRVMRAAACSSR